MRYRTVTNHLGSLHLVVVFVLVVAVAGFAGYHVATTHKKAVSTSTASSLQTAGYTSKADITQADDGLSAASVDQSIDSSALDQDVNNML